MAVDQFGKTINVGDNVWMPGTVTAVNSTAITVLPTYGGTGITLAPDKVQKPRSFPDAP